MSISTQSFHCVVPNCDCTYFSSNVVEARICGSCNHTWFAHVINGCSQSEEAELRNSSENQTPLLALSSLVLFGVQAIPIRLRILLDKLLCILHHNKVFQLLLSFGWSYDDYVRGYKLKDTLGNSLSSWSTVNFTEEKLIMYQFLKFNWTKPLAQNMIVQQANECNDFNFYNNFIASAKSYEFTYSQLLARFYPDILNFYSPFRFLRSDRFWPLHSFYFGCVPSGEMLNSPRSNEAESTSDVHSFANSTNDGEMNYVLKLRESNDFNCSIERSELARTFYSPGTSKECNESEISKLSFMSESPAFPDDNHSKQLLLAIPQSRFGMRKTSESDCSSMHSNRNQTRIDYKLKNIKRVGGLVRRPWQTTLGYGGILMSNGKKRVLCSACNKTFCDKGALKIHYSAVHLKEMHRCTIEGCNMLFSSRRSRNRHSANPNTKLHMDHKRRNQMSLSQQPKIYPNSTLANIRPKNWNDREVGSSSTVPLSPKKSIFESLKVQSSNFFSHEGNHSSDSSVNTSCSEVAVKENSENFRPDAAKRANEVRTNKRKNQVPVKLVSDEVNTDRNSDLTLDCELHVKIESDSKTYKQEPPRENEFDMIRPSEVNFCYPNLSYYTLPYIAHHKSSNHLPSSTGMDSASRDYMFSNRCYQPIKLSPTEAPQSRGDALPESSNTTESFVCQISGCNASFPSKRSRDRHSSNILLHRKLLSTSSNCFSRDILSFKTSPTTRFMNECSDFNTGKLMTVTEGNEKHLKMEDSSI